jgi:hypothetical protein
MKKIKADVSLGNTNKEREDVVKRFMKMQKLLRHFEVEAFAFDPGVRCYVLGDGVKQVDIPDRDTWEWLEPLLKELVQWREYGKKFNMYMSKKERRKNETISKRS